VIHYKGINRLLNFLPAKNLQCKRCGNQYPMKRGKILYSRMYFNGPYCTKCGQVIGERKFGK
jgi:NAD-dependent SIR2 family protein deacetylase